MYEYLFTPASWGLIPGTLHCRITSSITTVYIKLKQQDILMRLNEFNLFIPFKRHFVRCC